MVISALPPEKQADVAKRIAQMDRTSPDVIKEVEGVLERKLASLVNQGLHQLSVVSMLSLISSIQLTEERRSILLRLLKLRIRSSADENQKEDVRIRGYSFTRRQSYSESAA